MKIRYKNKRLKYNLIFGSLWFVIGISGVIFSPENIFVYGYLIIGVLQLGTYLFENKKQYLTIENGMIIKNNLKSKSVKLKDITQVKKFAGDYILQTNSTELRINIDYIDPKSLSELTSLLATLEIK